jgi:hypothetical protein
LTTEECVGSTGSSYENTSDASSTESNVDSTNIAVKNCIEGTYQNQSTSTTIGQRINLDTSEDEVLMIQNVPHGSTQKTESTVLHCSEQKSVNTVQYCTEQQAKVEDVQPVQSTVPELYEELWTVVQKRNRKTKTPRRKNHYFKKNSLRTTLKDNPSNNS